MKHASQAQFGRPVAAVPSPSIEGPDKWALLQDLTDAAEDYELSHRTLSVLKALLTFLPGREIPEGPGAVVFPSNRTLSARLSGMPESTLRRHLGQLVRAGIVSRQDSGNRKRFARKVGNGIAIAFGFDLSPLAHLADRLSKQAAGHRLRREALMAMRDRVIMLRARVLVAQGPSPLTDDIARLLRRKPTEEALTLAIDSLSSLVDNPQETAQVSDEMGGTDIQNERHIQNSDKNDLDPEDARPSERTAQTTPPLNKEQSVTITDVTSRCSAYAEFFPERPRTWDDLIRVSDRLAPMVGIDQPVVYQAKKTMGEEATATVILCILERLSSVRSPGAYLRHLTKLAQTGQFQLKPMLSALKSPNCQLTI